METEGRGMSSVIILMKMGSLLKPLRPIPTSRMALLKELVQSSYGGVELSV
jgi:hypothetical protein